MKIRKTSFTNPALRIFGLLLLSLPFACFDPVEQMRPADSKMAPEIGPWIPLLDEFFEGPGIIVQNQQSVQEALQAVAAGDVIYIEPGVYEETITIDKPNIKLIGLQRANGEGVQIMNAADKKNSIASKDTGLDARIVNIENNVLQPRPFRHLAKRQKLQITKEQIGNDIAHYQFDLRVGDRPFDVVRVHRVVREGRSLKSVRSRGAVFMLHGASLTFESIFLLAGGSEATAQSSAAVYLAANNIDVWGMDFAWTLVPAETTDFAFMADWGVERDVDHTLAAVSVARLIRGLTGEGFGTLNLLGFSYGAGVAYAAAGRETQQHPILRDVKGIVAVDQVLKFAPSEEGNRQLACAAAAAALRQINDGVYRSNGGQIFGLFATLAGSNPDGASPLIPGFSNYQAALFIGTSTFALRNPATPFWHFVGGDFSGGTFPVPSGLLYSDPARWIGLLGSLPPYQPQVTTYEARACVCDEVDVTMDDHLGEVTVPILYIGAGGTFGRLGDFTAGLTSSDDVAIYTVSLQPESEAVSDFGHADLFIGNNAPDLVWKELQNWLVNHHTASDM